MLQKTLNIGVMSLDNYKKRTFAIARGEYKLAPNEPKIWFESIQSLAQVLSNENQKLLRIILERQPESLRELEQMTGKRSSNLSRTLKTMEKYGIVELVKKERSVKPLVKATDFQVKFGLTNSRFGTLEKTPGTTI